MYNTFLQRVQLVKNNRGYTVPILNAIDYIETHVRENVTLAAIAKELGYTTYYLSGLFKRETKEPITVYIQKRKIETAKSLLRDFTLSINDISQMMSFSSPSYFCSTFKKYMGMTPNSFREKIYKE